MKEFYETRDEHVQERLASQQQEIKAGDTVVSRDGREYYVAPDGSWRRMDKLKGVLPGGPIVETINCVISRTKPGKKSIRKAKANGITTKSTTEGGQNGTTS